MFSIYQLKSRFQRLLQPVIAWLVACRVSPNQLTLGTMGLMLAYAALLCWMPAEPVLWMLFPLLLLVRMALNALDGMLAVQTKQTSPLGAMLNEMCDVVSDTALMLPFAFLHGMYLPLWGSAVVLSILAEFSGLCALAAGAPRGYEGPMGKSDRAFVMALVAILVACQPPMLERWLHAIFLGANVLLVWTIFNRLRGATLHAAQRSH
jgi:CDP-diacylglycerol--glycerol-3-phosphate 3-phosphatidyltransferase